MGVSDSERMGMLLSHILVREMEEGEEIDCVMVDDNDDDVLESRRGIGGEFISEGWDDTTLCGVGETGLVDSNVFEKKLFMCECVWGVK